jgi:hypothetical protein
MSADVSDRIETPSLCVVRAGRGERISGTLASLLNPVDPSSFHQYMISEGGNEYLPSEIHYLASFCLLFR